jgi:peroxin-10
MAASLSESLPVASSADIIRSTLKDEEYIASLYAELAGLFESVLPNSLSSSPVYPSSIAAFTRIIYTTFSLRRAPRRTPGNEYVAILPVRAAAPVSMTTTVVLAVLHALGRPLALVLARRLWCRLASSRRRAHFPSHSLEAVLEFCERAHLATFYIAGTYYCFANRILRLRYVQTIAPLFEGEAGNRYQVLGVLLSVQLGASAAGRLRSTYRRTRRRRSVHHASVEHRTRSRAHSLEEAVAYLRTMIENALFPHGTGDIDEGESGDEENDRPGEGNTSRNHPSREDGSGREASVPRRSCPLCLASLKSPALTTCGHVFCWKCVASWCAQSKDQCPLCRHPLQMHRDLVTLVNF